MSRIRMQISALLILTAVATTIMAGQSTTTSSVVATAAVPSLASFSGRLFGALNRDFRYQLTCIGGFAPVYIAEELANNRFKIGCGRPGMKISWQVTGTRHDAWADAHRIPVEETRPKDERGTYVHPEIFGAPQTAAVGCGRYRFPDNVAQLPRVPSRLRNRAVLKPAQTQAAGPAASH